MFGINASGAQWCGCISTLCYTHLKLFFLLHKAVLVTFLLTSAVLSILKFLVVKNFIGNLYNFSNIRSDEAARHPEYDDVGRIDGQGNNPNPIKVKVKLTQDCMGET